MGADIKERKNQGLDNLYLSIAAGIVVGVGLLMFLGYYIYVRKKCNDEALFYAVHVVTPVQEPNSEIRNILQIEKEKVEFSRCLSRHGF